MAVVLTLALGIGANATMFGVVDRLLLEHVLQDLLVIWLARYFLIFRPFSYSQRRALLRSDLGPKSPFFPA